MRTPKLSPATSAACLAILLSASPDLGAAVQSESIPLNYGWNSVWLSVEPVDEIGQPRTVEQVFQGVGFVVDVVAQPLETVGPAQFVTSPSLTLNQSDWLVWYANPVSGENDIFPVTAHQAYLVHVTGPDATVGNIAGAVTVSGEVWFTRPAWRAGSYNLIGFSVSGSLTFNDYLGALGEPLITAAGGTPVVQRLDSASSSWVGVDGDETIVPSQAYWVWAPTRLVDHHYAGPVAVRIDGVGGLDYGTGPGTIEVPDPAGPAGATLNLSKKELTFANLDTTSSHAITLTKISPANDDLRLFALEPQPDSLSWRIPSGSGVAPITSWSVLNLPPQTTKTVTAGADRNWTTGSPTRENLYRLDVSLGSGSCYFWLPVEATRADVPVEASGDQDTSVTSAGLWVGQVVLENVTSLAEDGAPLKPAVSAFPMEIMLHSDGTNPPVLLSHALFMKTKSVDEDIPTEPVLVVDEAKIPFFEGIEERGGKRVGRRIESSTYDMPRKLDPVTQAALASSQNLGTTAAITAFVNAQEQRPAALVEDYHLTWPLSGVLGPNGTVRTASTTEGDTGDLPLNLDPFHRSNPFRHAFHPRHGAGYPITRRFSIHFDGTNEDGLLRGTYEESVTGLTASAHPLAAQGSIVLRRVTSINVLH